MDDDDAAALASGLRVGVRGVCIGGLQARLLLPEEQAARRGHQRLRGRAGAVPRLPSHHRRDIAQSPGGTEDRIMTWCGVIARQHTQHQPLSIG